MCLVLYTYCDHIRINKFIIIISYMSCRICVPHIYNIASENNSKCKQCKIRYSIILRDSHKIPMVHISEDKKKKLIRKEEGRTGR